MSLNWHLAASISLSTAGIQSVTSPWHTVRAGVKTQLEQHRDKLAIARFPPSAASPLALNATLKCRAPGAGLRFPHSWRSLLWLDGAAAQAWHGAQYTFGD